MGKLIIKDGMLCVGADGTFVTDDNGAPCVCGGGTTGECENDSREEFLLKVDSFSFVMNSERRWVGSSPTLDIDTRTVDAVFTMAPFQLSFGGVNRLYGSPCNGLPYPSQQDGSIDIPVSLNYLYTEHQKGRFFGAEFDTTTITQIRGVRVRSVYLMGSDDWFGTQDPAFVSGILLIIETQVRTKPDGEDWGEWSADLEQQPVYIAFDHAGDDGEYEGDIPLDSPGSFILTARTTRPGTGQYDAANPDGLSVLGGYGTIVEGIPDANGPPPSGNWLYTPLISPYTTWLSETYHPDPDYTYTSDGDAYIEGEIKCWDSSVDPPVCGDSSGIKIKARRCDSYDDTITVENDDRPVGMFTAEYNGHTYYPTTELSEDPSVSVVWSPDSCPSDRMSVAYQCETGVAISFDPSTLTDPYTTVIYNGEKYAPSTDITYEPPVPVTGSPDPCSPAQSKIARECTDHSVTYAYDPSLVPPGFRGGIVDPSIRVLLTDEDTTDQPVQMRFIKSACLTSDPTGGPRPKDDSPQFATDAALDDTGLSVLAWGSILKRAIQILRLNKLAPGDCTGCARRAAMLDEFGERVGRAVIRYLRL